MSELESQLDSLLTQCSLSQNSLEKPCDDNLFLALMLTIPRFDNAAPFFGLTESEIEAIHCDYTSEKSRRLHMLWKWRRKNGSHATYLALITIFLQMEDKYLAEIVMQHTESTYLTESNDSKLNPEKTTMYPNWDKMSKAEQEQVKNKLIHENDEVREEYSNLILSISESLEKRKVAVEDLKLQLSAYGTLPRDSPDDNISQVLIRLYPHHTSWFNTKLIKVIVQGKLGCEDDQQMLAEYEEKTLLPYLQRSIFEIPSKSFAHGQENSGVKYLYVRLRDHDIPTGQEVYYLQRNISKYLGISEEILQFIGFEDGSIILIFQLPEALLERQTSMKSHITFDSVKNVYNFNDDELNQIL